MQLDGSQKLGRFANGIMKAARARRELESDTLGVTVESDDEMVDSGIRSVGNDTGAAVMEVFDGNVETVH